MQLVFLDDSRQNAPSRNGMSPLVGIGGIAVAADRVHGLERELRALCGAIGFPRHEPFKWSPGRALWMRDNLVDERRRNFFLEALRLVGQADAVALVAISATDCNPASRTARTPEQDVTNLALERIHHYLGRYGGQGIVIGDRPSGARPDEERFLLGCLETLLDGAGYVIPDRICMNVVSSPARYIRLLQMADLIVSCTLAYVSGERTHSPPIFEGGIRGLLYSDGGRIGGLGLKLHPDYRYVNLYHWLLRDTHFLRFGVGYPLPMERFPYSAGPDNP